MRVRLGVKCSKREWRGCVGYLFFHESGAVEREMGRQWDISGCIVIGSADEVVEIRIAIFVCSFVHLP